MVLSQNEMVEKIGKRMKEVADTTLMLRSPGTWARSAPVAGHQKNATGKTTRPRGAITKVSLLIKSPLDLKTSTRIAWLEADAFPTVMLVATPGAVISAGKTNSPPIVAIDVA